MTNACTPVCNCKFTMLNTGVDCTPIMEVVQKLLLFPVYDSTGVRNYIDLASPINAQLFSDMINEADGSKRLYPLPNLKDIKDTRGEPIRETYPDRSSSFIAEGVRTFDGIIVGRDGNTIIKGQIESARCGEMGVYGVDRLGNLIGVISSDGTQLFPIRLDSDSISVNYIKKTDTTQQKLQITFNYHPDESDNCLRMVAADELGGASLLTLKGLLDVFVTFSDITTTGATAFLFTKYGTVLNPVEVEGLVITNFVSTVGGATSNIRNTTTSADVALTSVTESTTVPGSYALVFPAQTSADVLAVDCVKLGFDFTAVALSPLTIP